VGRRCRSTTSSPRCWRASHNACDGRCGCLSRARPPPTPPRCAPARGARQSPPAAPRRRGSAGRAGGRRAPARGSHTRTVRAFQWAAMIAGMRRLAQRGGRARWLGRGGVRDSMGRVAVTLTRAGALCRPRRLLLWPVLYRAWGAIAPRHSPERHASSGPVIRRQRIPASAGKLCPCIVLLFVLIVGSNGYGGMVY